MKQQIILSRALLRLSPPMSPELDAKARQTLAALAQKEEKIVKRKVSLGLILAVGLVLLLTGAAVALTQLGIWDFVKDYGETPLPKAQGMVQTDFGENTMRTYALGDASVTLREAVSDGLMGSLVAEYRAPEGSYLYAPDSRQLTDPPIFGEKESMEAIFAKYGTFYHERDEKIGVMKDGELELLDEIGFDVIKTADNVLVVSVSFCLSGIDPDQLVYNPGLFKMDSADFEQRQRLVAEIPLKLEQNLDKCETVTPALSDEAAAAGITSVTVTSTPLTLAVKVQFERMERDGTYYFEAQREPGVALDTSHLSSFAGFYDPNNNSATCGYAPVEELPKVIYIQVKGTDVQTGEEKLIGDPVEVSLR